MYVGFAKKPLATEFVRTAPVAPPSKVFGNGFCYNSLILYKASQYMPTSQIILGILLAHDLPLPPARCHELVHQ